MNDYNNQDLYKRSIWKPADQLLVNRLRLILTWPLVLRIEQQSTKFECSDVVLKRLNNCVAKSMLAADGPWKRVLDLADHAPIPQNIMADSEGNSVDMRQVDAVQSYGEMVFYFDYIRDKLLAKQASDGNPLDEQILLFRRNDISHLDFSLNYNGKILTAFPRVENMTMHLFKTGVAMLSVELEFGLTPCLAENSFSDALAAMPLGSKRKMTLADTQIILDHLRRIYTPYFNIMKGTPSTAIPQKVPIGFQWRYKQKKTDNDGATILEDSPAPQTPLYNKSILNADDFRGDTHQPERPDGRRSLPVDPHWREIVRPLKLDGDAELLRHQPVFRQVTDERIPLMSFIKLEGFNPDFNQVVPTKSNHLKWLDYISRGDWMRLCFADEPGSAPLPYSREFLRNFETDHCYDRYLPSDEAPFYSTRYMFAGYHFSMVSEGWFADNLAVHHFRHHYYNMALMINLELATLLSISSQVSDAVYLHNSAASQHSFGSKEYREQALEKRLNFAEKSFLTYSHLYHFGGLSNQLQPTEMFNIWRRQSKVDMIYEEVKVEVAAGNEFLRNQKMMQQADSAHHLNYIALVGLFISAVFSMLGMNAWINSEASTPDFAGMFDNSQIWAVFFASGLLASGALIVSILINVVVREIVVKNRLLVVLCLITIFSFLVADWLHAGDSYLWKTIVAIESTVHD